MTNSALRQSEVFRRNVAAALGAAQALMQLMVALNVEEWNVLPSIHAEPFFAALLEQHGDRINIDTLIGEELLVAGRPLLVEPSLDQLLFFEAEQVDCQNVGRNFRFALQIVKATHADEQFLQHRKHRAVAENIESPFYRVRTPRGRRNNRHWVEGSGRVRSALCYRRKVALRQSRRSRGSGRNYGTVQRVAGRAA